MRPLPLYPGLHKTHPQVIEDILNQGLLIRLEIPFRLFLEHPQDVNGLLGHWKILVSLGSDRVRDLSQLDQC